MNIRKGFTRVTMLCIFSMTVGACLTGCVGSLSEEEIDRLGINFNLKSVIKGTPHAIGLNRSLDTEKEPFAALEWGLTHEYKTWNYQYIRRFQGKRVASHVAKGAKSGAKK
jgi:hypothetical protein